MGTLIGATDGLEKDGKMVGGWTLYDTQQPKLVTGTTPILGNPLTSNSTQPEQGIQVSLLRDILLAAQTNTFKSGKVRIYIDNITSFAQTKNHQLIKDLSPT